MLTAEAGPLPMQACPLGFGGLCTYQGSRCGRNLPPPTGTPQPQRHSAYGMNVCMYVHVCVCMYLLAPDLQMTTNTRNVLCLHACMFVACTKVAFLEHTCIYKHTHTHSQRTTTNSRQSHRICARATIYNIHIHT